MPHTPQAHIRRLHGFAVWSSGDMQAAQLLHLIPSGDEHEAAQPWGQSTL